MWLVYIIKCADKSLYTGITNNLKKRLLDHKIGIGSKYVRSRLPFELVYTEKASSKENALKREFEIKRLSRDKKLELLGLK